MTDGIVILAVLTLNIFLEGLLYILHLLRGVSCDDSIVSAKLLNDETHVMCTTHELVWSVDVTVLLSGTLFLSFCLFIYSCVLPERKWNEL